MSSSTLVLFVAETDGQTTNDIVFQDHILHVFIMSVIREEQARVYW